MIKENKLLDFLKSNAFILYVAIFTVIFQAPNTYYVYHSFSVFSSPYREIASAGVAIIVSASIMIYTLRKNFFVAKCYSVFEVGIACYYYADTIGWDWGLIPAFAIALIVPISVFHFTNEINKESNSTISGAEIDKIKNAYARDYADLLRQVKDDYEGKMSSHVMEIQQLLTVIDNKKIELSGLQSEVDKANSIIDRDAETIAVLTRDNELKERFIFENIKKITPNDDEAGIEDQWHLKNEVQPVDVNERIIELVQKAADNVKKKFSEEKQQGFWNSKENTFF